MNKYLCGIVAGFIATVVLSILMLIKSMMGVLPALDLIAMLSGMGNRWMHLPDTPMVGWIIHFMIGTLLWGIVFALVHCHADGRRRLVRHAAWADGTDDDAGPAFGVGCGAWRQLRWTQPNDSARVKPWPVW